MERIRLFVALMFTVLICRCAVQRGIYFECEGGPAAVGSIKTKKLRLLWEKSLCSAPGRNFGLFEDNIIVYELGNRLYFISRRGKITRTIKLKGCINHRVVIDGRYAYFTLSGGRFGFVRLNLYNVRERVEKGIKSCVEPVVKDSLVLVVSVDGKVYCMRKENLEPVWVRDLNSRVYVAPFVDENFVYIIGADRRLFAINVPDGKVKRIKLPCVAETAVFVCDTLLIFGCGSGRLLFFDRVRNRLRGVVRLSGRIVSKPYLKGDTLIVGTMSDSIYYVDVESGDVLERVYVREPVSTDMVEIDGALVFGSLAGKLICFDINDKCVIWSCKLKGRVISNPFLFENFLVVGCEYKHVYLFRVE